MSNDFQKRLAAMSPANLMQEHFEATTHKLAGDALETERHRVLTFEIMRRLVKLEVAESIFKD